MDKDSYLIFEAYSKASPITSAKYEPTDFHKYYSISDAVVHATSDKKKQVDLARQIVVKVFELIDNALDKIKSGKADDDIISRWESIRKPKEMDKFFGPFVRAGITKVLPKSPYKGRGDHVIRDVYAARGIREALISNGLLTRSDDTSARKQAIDTAEDKVEKDVVRQVATAKPKVARAPRVDTAKRYMVVREPRMGELSSLAHDIFDKWPIEEGEPFKWMDEVNRLNKFSFSQGKGNEFLKELLKKGLIERAEEGSTNPDQMVDVDFSDDENDMYAARDYYDAHFKPMHSGLDDY